MAITERQVLGKIEVLEGGQIQLRQDTVIERDGVEVSRLYHRVVLEPTLDTTTLTGRLKDVADVVWTTEVVEQFEQDKQARVNAAIPSKL